MSDDNRQDGAGPRPDVTHTYSAAGGGDSFIGPYRLLERIGEGVSPNRIGERVWIYEAQLDCQFSLEQVAAAHEAQDSGQAIGKVLIEIA